MGVSMIAAFYQFWLSLILKRVLTLFFCNLLHINFARNYLFHIILTKILKLNVAKSCPKVWRITRNLPVRGALV